MLLECRCHIGERRLPFYRGAEIAVGSEGAEPGDFVAEIVMQGEANVVCQERAGGNRWTIMGCNVF
jgi:hypothetical protein